MTDLDALEKLARIAIGGDPDAQGKMLEVTFSRESLAAFTEAVRQEERERAEQDLKAMVNRFLGWKLPADFGPDAGISFKPYLQQQTPDSHLWPVGTNLFTADQAHAMLKYVVFGERK